MRLTVGRVYDSLNLEWLAVCCVETSFLGPTES